MRVCDYALAYSLSRLRVQGLYVRCLPGSAVWAHQFQSRSRINLWNESEVFDFPYAARDLTILSEFVHIHIHFCFQCYLYQKWQMLGIFLSSIRPRYLYYRLCLRITLPWSPVCWGHIHRYYLYSRVGRERRSLFSCDHSSLIQQSYPRTMHAVCSLFLHEILAEFLDHPDQRQVQMMNVQAVVRVPFHLASFTASILNSLFLLGGQSSPYLDRTKGSFDH